jgi:hypothetical protein
MLIRAQTVPTTKTDDFMVQHPVLIALRTWKQRDTQVGVEDLIGTQNVKRA